MAIGGMVKARLLEAFLNIRRFGPVALLLPAGCAHTAQLVPRSAPAPAPLRIYGMHQTIELAQALKADRCTLINDVGHFDRGSALPSGD